MKDTPKTIVVTLVAEIEAGSSEEAAFLAGCIFGAYDKVASLIDVKFEDKADIMADIEEEIKNEKEPEFGRKKRGKGRKKFPEDTSEKKQVDVTPINAGIYQ